MSKLHPFTTNANKMRPEEFLSTWECYKCGMVHNNAETDSDDEEDPECWGCDALDKANSVSALTREIKHLRDELESVKKRHKDDIKRIADTLSEVKLEQEVAKQLRKTTSDTMRSHTTDIKSMKENGVVLSKENIKIVKKIAKKIAIKEIVEWESE